MMFFSEILFLSFAVNVWATPLPLDADGAYEYVEEPESPISEDLNINNHEISITKSSQPIVEIFDPFHRGYSAIGQTADKGYQKLLTKVPRLNYQLDSRFANGYGIPLSQRQPTTNNFKPHPSNNWSSSYSKESSNVVSGSHQLNLSAQVGPPVMDNVPFNNNSNYSVWQSLQNFINKFSKNNQNNRDGSRLTRQTVGNYQVFYPSQVFQGYLVPIPNQDGVKATTANPELNDKLPESSENQSGSTMTTSADEVLQTTTAIPTEFESTTTFETTTEIPTTESNEEEIILSTTQPELLDKNAEIDEAIAFNIDDGNISSTQESATQSSEINKDNFYVIYGRPTLTKKDNSLLVNAKVGMAVALSGSNFDDVQIINLV